MPAWSVAGDAPAGAAPRHAAVHGAGLYWTRCPAGDAARLDALIDAGWRPVDMAVTLERAPAPDAGEPSGAVRDAGPGDRAAVADLAARAFRLTRFHLDPRVPDAAAGALKRAWAANCVDGTRGSGVRVAVRDGAVAGFLAVLVAADGARVIDLVAVDPAWQGRGVGRDLVRDFVRREGPRGPALRVGTQAANVPSIRLYESCGFRVRDTAYVLHLHAAGR